MRLDIFLTKQMPELSRNEAQRLIKNGAVTVNQRVEQKPSYSVNDCDTVELLGALPAFVSRGGEKLKAALVAFGISPKGCCCVDVGASTGGFTDCLLQHGADFVYAVENGHGQLALKLQNHPCVLSLEHYNARNLQKADFPKPITFSTMDVSFISQTLILPGLYSILEPGAYLVTLIKPQFEVGRASIGKGGIVKDRAAREGAVNTVLSFAESCGFVPLSTMVSPILGGDGNTEYLALMKKP